MPNAQTIDLSGPEFIDNPYPAYRELRRAGEPCWLPHEDRSGTEGIWLFSRYEDVARILRETGSVSKDVSRLVPTDRLTAFDRMLLNMDPPEHTRLRAVVAPLFGVRSVARMESWITDIVTELVDGIVPGEPFDFMARFAVPLPIRVVARVLGVPAGDMPRLKAWTDDIITGLDSVRAGPRERERVADSMAALTRYLAELIEHDDQPENSLLAHVAEARSASGVPTPGESLSLSLLMVLAGHETTVNLLGNGLLTLLRHPRQLRRLRAEPALIPCAVDEMLRFESPLQRATFRVTTAPVRIGGMTLDAGQQLSAVIGAANRDPAEFDAPETFDIARRPNRHLAFGKGIHKCLGERVAKAEARIAFSALLARFGDFELLDEAPRWQRKTLFRGLESLTVAFT